MSVPDIVAFAYKNFVPSEENGGKSKAECKFCSKVSIHDSGKSTSNKNKHFKRYHKDRFEEYAEFRARATTQGNTLDSFVLTSKAKATPSELQKYGSNHPRQIAISVSIVNDLIIGCSLPLSSTENRHFRQFLKTINPNYTPIARSTITSTKIPESVTRVKNIVAERLKECDSITTTTDIWSDRKMRGYLGITAHVLEENEPKKTLECTSFLLHCNRVTGKHTGERISNAYLAAVKEFDIENKIDFVVTDNAANMRKAFTVQFPTEDECNLRNNEEDDEVASSEDENPDIENEDLWEDLPNDVLHEVIATLKDNCRHADRLSCFAHTLQLVVGDGLKDAKCVRPAMSKVIRLSSLLHTSCRFKDEFEDAFGKDVTIPAATTTRWNSTLRQVSSVLSLDGNKLNHLLETLEHDNITLRPREISTLNELVQVLDPFLQVTDETQGENTVTISCVVPGVLRLHNYLTEMKSTARHCQPLITSLLKSLEKRFRGIFQRVKMTEMNDAVANDRFGDPVYLMAAVLDPDWGFTWIDEDMIASPDDKEQLKCEIKAFLRQELERVSLPENTSENEEDTANPVEPKPKKPKFMARPNRQRMASGSDTRTISGELSAYFEMCSENIEDDCLKFWYNQRQKLPRLYSVAKRILSMLAEQMNGCQARNGCQRDRELNSQYCF